MKRKGLLMDSFDKNEFNNFVGEKKVFGFNCEAKDLDGVKSWFFIDWKPLLADACLTDRLADFVLAFVKSVNLKVDTFYGVPESATKLALICQYKMAKQSKYFNENSHALSLGRGNPRMHHEKPEDNYFLGKPKGNVVVIEDVVASGDSLLETLGHLKEAGVFVGGVIALSDRLNKRKDGLSVKEAIEKRGIKFYCMTSVIEILPIMYKKLAIRTEIGKVIEAEFKNFHSRQIRLV